MNKSYIFEQTITTPRGIIRVNSFNKKITANTSSIFSTKDPKFFINYREENRHSINILSLLEIEDLFKSKLIHTHQVDGYVKEQNVNARYAKVSLFDRTSNRILHTTCTNELGYFIFRNVESSHRYYAIIEDRKSVYKLVSSKIQTPIPQDI